MNFIQKCTSNKGKVCRVYQTDAKWLYPSTEIKNNIFCYAIQRTTVVVEYQE